MKPAIRNTIARIDALNAAWGKSHGGKRYASERGMIITDATVLLLVKGEGGGEPNDRIASTLHAELMADAAPVPVDGFLRWLRDVAPRCERCDETQSVPCPGCAGGGTTIHECDCEFCQITAETQCQDCGGDGLVPCLHQRPVGIGQRCFDARRVLAVLPGAPNDVAITADGVLRMHGDGWCALVMRMAADDDAHVGKWGGAGPESQPAEDPKP